jgi:hypothetical protein
MIAGLLIVLGFVYANFIEVIAHRFFLHGLGKKKNSIFAFHWHTHHRACRQNDMIDEEYSQPWYSKNRLFEVVALTILMTVNAFLFWSFPFFLIGVGIYLVAYYNIHKFCHVYPGLAKKWFKGHYFHHMGKNQDLNWGTPIPLADFIMGTSYLNKKNKQYENGY